MSEGGQGPFPALLGCVERRAGIMRQKPGRKGAILLLPPNHARRVIFVFGLNGLCEEGEMGWYLQAKGFDMKRTALILGIALTLSGPLLFFGNSPAVWQGSPRDPARHRRRALDGHHDS